MESKSELGKQIEPISINTNNIIQRNYNELEHYLKQSWQNCQKHKAKKIRNQKLSQEII